MCPQMACMTGCIVTLVHLFGFSPLCLFKCPAFYLCVWLFEYFVCLSVSVCLYHSIQFCKEVELFDYQRLNYTKAHHWATPSLPICISTLYLYSMYLYLSITCICICLIRVFVFVWPRWGKRPATTFPPSNLGRSRLRSPYLNLTRDVRTGLKFKSKKESSNASTSPEMWE